MCRKLTYDDYLLFPEDGCRHELIDGRHFATPTPDLRHQTLLLNLALALSPFVRERKLGFVWVPSIEVVLSDHDVVQPDLVAVFKDRLHLLNEQNLRGAPDLVAEVLSPSTRERDLSSKLRLYECSGVPEYWVIDPDEDTAAIYRSGEGEYKLWALLSAKQGHELSSPLLPGWAFALQELFNE